MRYRRRRKQGKDGKKKPGTRIAKTNRVPKTRCGGRWTEAAFWGFIRAGLRHMSQRWSPLVRDALLRVRRPSQSDNKLLKWEYQCESCYNWFSRKQVQVDHIESCGTLKCFADIARFVERLLCEVDELRVLCKHCHEKRADPRMNQLRIKSDGEKLLMFREVSEAMQKAKKLASPLRVDILADFIEKHPQDLPVFLRWIWNEECHANITWAELRRDPYCPTKGAEEHLGFWLMMSRTRRRGDSPEEKEQSFHEWKDSLCQYDERLVMTAVDVLRKRPGWGLNLLHINSALEAAGQTNQTLPESDGPSDFMER